MLTTTTRGQTNTDDYQTPEGKVNIPNLFGVILAAESKVVRDWYKGILNDQQRATVKQEYLAMLRNKDNFDQMKNYITDAGQLELLDQQHKENDFNPKKLDDFELLGQILTSIDSLYDINITLYIYIQQKNSVDPVIVRDWYQEELSLLNRERIIKIYLDMLQNDEQFALMKIATNAKFGALLDQQRAAKKLQPSTLEDFELINLFMLNLEVAPHLLLSLRSYSQKQEIANEKADKILIPSSQPSANEKLTPSRSWSFSKFILGMVALTIAVIFMPITAFVYTIAKLSKAISNLYNHHKIRRSVTRFVGFYLGAGVGVLVGLSVGATLGSIIPGFGTLAGAIVGAICMSSIGAAVGIFVAKKVNQFLSWCAVRMGLYGNEQIINPTNPDEKYRLTPVEKQAYVAAGISDTAQIYKMMAAIRTQLVATKTMVPSTEQHQTRLEYLQLLKAVKTCPSIARKKFYQSGNAWFHWTGETWVDTAKPTTEHSDQSHIAPVRVK
jgi:hypothetical protein